MKTKLEIPDELAEKVHGREEDSKPWTASFGKLRGLHAETERVNRLIEAEFETIEAEERS